MKKVLFVLSLNMLMAGRNSSSYGQISKGGLPYSLQQDLSLPNLSIHQFESPDWNGFLEKEKSERPQDLFSKPFKVGLHVAADISFPNSGQMYVLANGARIWRTVISVANAPAIALLMDRFYLPEGVTLFLTNANKRQVVGAFDKSNNDISKKFAIDAVQGDVVQVELNIASNVNLNSIEFHIDRLLVFQRAIEHLNRFKTPIDEVDDQLNNGSSICNINAICPQGANYENSRRATVQTIDMSDGSVCSGTLVNNTANTASNCKPYLLTASHCQGDGSLSNARFNQMLVRFNFERPDCEGLMATDGKSMMGVNVLSRANYHEDWPVEDIDGDFMVYELRTAIPVSYGAVLAGWNRQTAIPVSHTAPKKFIGFHHAFADNKKLSTSQVIESRSWPADVTDAAGTRWVQVTQEGYVAPGSSGSALFDGDGHIIGIASVASFSDLVPDSCFYNSSMDEVYAMDSVWYDKLSHAWEYSANGTDNNRRLQPWLDPANTGVLSLEAVTSGCLPVGTTSIKPTINDFGKSISVFPNPSTNGNFYIQFNFENAIDLTLSVHDIRGRKVYSSLIKDAIHGIKNFELNDVSNGMYLVKLESRLGAVTKKIVISK